MVHEIIRGGVPKDPPGPFNSEKTWTNRVKATEAARRGQAIEIRSALILFECKSSG